VRNRHLARVCRACHAPMASGAGTCWRCGVEWAQEGQPPARLRLVTSAPPEVARDVLPAAATAALPKR